VQSTTISTLTESTTTATEVDRQLMLRSFELARKGSGLVSPGPLVGCVIVDVAGEIVGEGFYVFEDVKHAETIALAQAGEKARGGTAYVSLEPHAHRGRTSPCTDALIQAGIKRVVAPIEDLNPKVSGKGFAHLREAGIEVQTGLLATEAARVNEAYLHFMRTGRPFVHLKLAVSLDGKIATRSGDSRWVAGPESRAKAHELRHEYDTILVGLGTAVVDDPMLTDRSGLKRRRPLARIILDERAQLPTESQLVKSAKNWPVVLFAGPQSDDTRHQELERHGVEVVKMKDRGLLGVLDELGRRSLQSVLVEGGAHVAGRFVDAGLVNKATFFIAPKIVGDRAAPGAVNGTGVEFMRDARTLHNVTVSQLGNDVEVTGYFPDANE
jgi:diaminohydroxyphosphoribosylaminopyrimidine deaminase / 5-amino-6-(5-phosphoribosylamino)uracil reductase